MHSQWGEYMSEEHVPATVARHGSHVPSFQRQFSLCNKSLREVNDLRWLVRCYMDVEHELQLAGCISVAPIGNRR